MHHACPYPVCRCGTEVDINRASPVLRDPNDIVLQNDSVDSMYSYHSGGYENWPDLAAYTADMTLAGRPRAGFDPQRMVESKTSLALHLGTYESAFENMLRRLHDQDVGDPSEIRYWPHRVQIPLKPGDLGQHVGDESASLMGDVLLSEVHTRGGRAARYINVHEAAGSVSVAVDCSVNHTRPWDVYRSTSAPSGDLLAPLHDRRDERSMICRMPSRWQKSYQSPTSTPCRPPMPEPRPTRKLPRIPSLTISASSTARPN